MSGIRTNKLIQQAVKAADLPVLWSWFRYGQSIANSVAMGREVGYESLSEAGEETAAKDAHPNAKSKGWYRDFFIEDVEIGGVTGIKAICEIPLNEFLEAAYEEAPDEHQPLYLANLEMQEILREIALSDDWHEQDPDGEFYQDVWDVSRRFQRELILHDELPVSDTQTISQYLRLLRQAVAATCAVSNNNLTSDHTSELYSLAEIYHDPIWKLPAMRISSLTVHGRNKRNNGQNTARRLRINFKMMLKIR
ncbi:hypothetical protein [Halorubrum sp. 2020YC2]|uniref:hypothetical protein n=1 Tax=Halorubrum sp. 2020YC2 TaxID=2836432 RepID=UPI001BE6785D|nr:hypothetical protein [Halorubrum sp. 2020YC2]QWC18110.1 hypothetical protein KI388_07945 [Halorubrum sp. 2020YC2]